MIQSLTIRNFRSIEETQVAITFAEGKAPNGYQDYPVLPFIQVGASRKARVCPALALYGANGSGKTTLLLALEFIAKIVRSGWSPRMYQPNLTVSSCGDKNTSDFEIEFWSNTLLYRYCLSINKDGITQERLEVNQKTLFSIDNGEILFEGNSSAVTLDATQCYRMRCQNVRQHQIKTFLTEVTYALPAVTKEITRAKDYLVSNLIFIQGEVSFKEGMKALAQTFEGTGKEKKATDLMLNFLRKLDVSIVGMQLHAGKSADGSPSSRLKIGRAEKEENEMWLNLADESKGTQRILGLFPMLLAAIREGKVICVDQLDDSVHSLVLIQFVRLFKARQINKMGAQLIFTVNNTDVLASGLLGLSEVGIVSRRGPEGSKVLRLVDVPSLRNSDEFRRRYLRGDFGGIPFPYVFAD